MPFLATLRTNTQLVIFFGATSLFPRIEQGPVSDHVFLPAEMELMNEVTRVADPRFTVVFFTLKPGRTELARVAELVRPVGERVVMTNE
jgi:hypothetical protein